MWKSLATGAALSGALLFMVSGCGQSPPPPTKPKGPSPASQAWLSLSRAFIEDYMQAQPAFAAQAGRHEFDGQLPDVSAHGLKREIARLHDERDQIAGVDASTLEPRERFDREYLLAVLDKDLFWIEKTQFPFSNPGWYLGQIDPDIYLSRNYAPLEVRMKAYIKYARGISSRPCLRPTSSWGSTNLAVSPTFIRKMSRQFSHPCPTPINKNS